MTRIFGTLYDACVLFGLVAIFLAGWYATP